MKGILVADRNRHIWGKISEIEEQAYADIHAAYRNSQLLV
jgi:hypothetical protein